MRFCFFLKTDISFFLGAFSINPFFAKAVVVAARKVVVLFDRAAVMAESDRGSSDRKRKKLSKADKVFEKLKECSTHYMKRKKPRHHVICDLTKKHTAANIERNRKERAAYARRKQKREQELRNSGPQQGASSTFDEGNDEEWSEVGGKTQLTS